MIWNYQIRTQVEIRSDSITHMNSYNGEKSNKKDITAWSFSCLNGSNNNFYKGKETSIWV